MASGQNGCVVIFGATGGIGTALVERLHRTDRQVFLAGRNEHKLAQLSARFGFPTARVDAKEPLSFQEALELAENEFSNIQGIVNCIGSFFLKPLQLTSSSDFQEVMQTNVGSSFEIMKSGIDAMKKTGGAMVFFSTAATRIGMPNHEAIAAAKSAIEGLAISAAASYANRGIRINVIAPGLVETEMTRSIWDHETNSEVSKRLHALGRFGHADEIAEVAEFLISPKNSWITGQIIGVDGGLGKLMPRRKK